MIAAEAFFLAERSGDKNQGELKYRLALNAAVYATPTTQELGKQQVLSLMKKAYDVRSVIAQGNEPSKKDLRLDGVDYTLDELMSVVRKIVASACRTALSQLSNSDRWPPNWTARILREDSDS